MAFQTEPVRVEAIFPAVASTDGACLLEQAGFFFLSGQASELFILLVVGPQEFLLAMQDWRVGAI